MLSSEMVETISLKSEITLVYSCLLHFSSLNLVSVHHQGLLLLLFSKPYSPVSLNCLHINF